MIVLAISDYLRSVGTSMGGAWPFLIIVHGGARGADQFADDAARGWGWIPEAHPADWARYDRSAGYRRNAAMVALGADVCLAFILDESRGASHTATLAEAAGIPTRGTSDGAAVSTVDDCLIPIGDAVRPDTGSPVLAAIKPVIALPALVRRGDESQPISLNWAAEVREDRSGDPER